MRVSPCVHKQGRGRDRLRERIPSRLCSVSTELDEGLDLTNCKLMTWAEIKSQSLNQLSHTGAPALLSLFVSPTMAFFSFLIRDRFPSAIGPLSLECLFWLPSQISLKYLLLSQECGAILQAPNATLIIHLSELFLLVSVCSIRLHLWRILNITFKGIWIWPPPLSFGIPESNE